MTGAVGRALRVLAPHDVRLVWRDGFLLFVVFALPIVCLLLRWLVPYATGRVAEWIDLEAYYGLILAYLLCQQPIVIGYVVGILFVEEREEGTLLALRTSPLPLLSLLGYRLLAGMLVSIVLSAVGVWLAGLVDISVLDLLATAVLSSLAAPLVALGYAAFLENKLQAVASGKLVQGWAGIPLFLFFAPTPWQWVGSVILPMYYPMRFFCSAAEGDAEWWLMLPGTLLLGGAVLWLLARFRRRLGA